MFHKVLWMKWLYGNTEITSFQWNASTLKEGDLLSRVGENIKLFKMLNICLPLLLPCPGEYNILFIHMCHLHYFFFFMVSIYIWLYRESQKRRKFCLLALVAGKPLIGRVIINIGPDGFDFACSSEIHTDRFASSTTYMELKHQAEVLPLFLA